MINKENIEELINNNLTLKEIAVELNVSYNTILRYCKKYNLKSTTGSKGAKKHTVNEHYFENIDTEDKAYWLGFIAADGNIHATVKNKPVNRIQINLKGDDKYHLESFQEAIKSNYAIQDKIVNGSSVAQLKINCTKMCNDLIANNITPKKSLTVTMPDIPQELIRHYIRGYFDGDGNIKNFYDKNNRHRYNFNIVGGIDMLEQIQQYIPCSTSIYRLKRASEIFSLETTKKDNMKIIYNYLYEDATIYLERKKDIFDDLMSRLAEMQGQ